MLTAGKRLGEDRHGTAPEHASAQREQHVRPRFRAGGRAPVRRRERVGQDAIGGVHRQVPGGADAVGRDRGPAQGAALGELRGDDVSREPRRARRALSDRPPAARDGRQRELLHHEHALSLVARASYPRLSFAGYPGEVSTSDAPDDEKEAARKSAEAELPRMLNVYRDFFLIDAGFIGGG